MKCPNCRSGDIYPIEKGIKTKGAEGVRFCKPTILGYVCRKCRYYWNRRKIRMKVKTFVLQSIGGFIFWAGTLTPYMLWVVKCSKVQYWKWLAMEIAICFLLISPSLKFINWFVRRLSK